MSDMKSGRAVLDWAKKALPTDGTAVDRFMEISLANGVVLERVGFIGGFDGSGTVEIRYHLHAGRPDVDKIAREAIVSIEDIVSASFRSKPSGDAD